MIIAMNPSSCDKAREHYFRFGRNGWAGLDGGFVLLAALFHAGDGPGEVGDGDDEEAVEKKN